MMNFSCLISISIVSVIIYVWFIFIKYINYKPCNISKEVSDEYIYDNNYMELTYEAYSKNPNIDKILTSITQMHKDISVPMFFLIDGIRIYAKSIRMYFNNQLSNKDGDIGMFYFQMKKYYQSIKLYDEIYRINNICEIGFQLGVGAITLITSVNHSVNYYGFDLGKKYSKDSFDLVNKYFPMKMIWGESKDTVPSFIKSKSSFEKCDVIHIDGCHTDNVIYNDIVNMKEISHSGSLLLLDDVSLNSLPIIKALKNNLIKNVKCYNKPYCIAVFY